MEADEVAFDQGHDWSWEVPYGMASDGVVVATCMNCDIQMVFDLDIDSAVVIEGESDSPICGGEEE